jgi:hypothetical protein
MSAPRRRNIDFRVDSSSALFEFKSIEGALAELGERFSRSDALTGGTPP